MPSNTNQSASLLGGHAQYAKGYTETIGNAVGSEEWKQSGKDHPQQGRDEMQTAGQQKDEPRPSTILGQMEETAGRAAGCDGMESEGKERTTLDT